MLLYLKQCVVKVIVQILQLTIFRCAQVFVLHAVSTVSFSVEIIKQNLTQCANIAQSRDQGEISLTTERLMKLFITND